MFARLMRYFLQGLILLAPITITLYVIFALVSWMDALIGDELSRHLDQSLPGLGFLIIIVLITFMGFLSSTFIFKPIFEITERVITRTPVVKIIYSSLKDLFSAFMGSSNVFKQPVLVDIDKASGLQKIGFITREDLNMLGQKNKIAVYFPHSYNFSGNLFITSSKSVTPLDLNGTDVLKFIASGGMTGLNVNEENSK